MDDGVVWILCEEFPIGFDRFFGQALYGIDFRQSHSGDELISGVVQFRFSWSGLFGFGLGFGLYRLFLFDLLEEAEQFAITFAADISGYVLFCFGLRCHASGCLCGRFV